MSPGDVRSEAPPQSGLTPSAGVLRLTEIFHSVQGEGSTVGLPTTFIRLTGCSLRCAWCDTTYSFYGGQDWTIPQVFERLSTIPVKRACITGGEPLDQHDSCIALMTALLEKGYFVVLETSGSIDVSASDKLEPRDKLQLSVDVKCPSSNMQKRNLYSNIAILREHDQLKFVISDTRDYEFAKEVLATHPTKSQVLFQPMWSSPDPVSPTKIVGEAMTLHALSERVLSDGLDVRVGTQLHKLIWGHEKGR